jgi:hypothetical protein
VAKERWSVVADVLLQRAALVARVAQGRQPDPLAGLKTDDEDMERLLAELPGLDLPDPAAVSDMEDALAPAVAEARDAFVEQLRADGPFATLVRGARLDLAEAEVLAVLCAVEMDPRRQRLVGYLNDDVTQRRLTLWTLRQLFAPDDDRLAAVGPGSGLRRAALLAPAADGPWASSPVAVAPPVMWWLHGDRSPDPELPPDGEVVSGPAVGKEHLVVATGADRLRRLQAVVTASTPTSFLVTPPPVSPTQWDALVRQATLAGLGIVLEVEDVLEPAARERVERADHLAWAISSPTDLPLAVLPRRPWAAVMGAPAAATREEWEATFGPVDALPYRLTAQQLDLVGRAAQAMDGDLPGAVRRLAAGHIDAVATRIRPTRGWDDLALDAERGTAVRGIAVRCRQSDTVFGTWGFSPEPSTGVVALFAGPSGTGKTLAAEVIAADLGVDLYKIDLANLVSKYIGETEKNLSRVFDAAEASNVALFFDEADALLGKRSAVSDAHDRYANIEVAYLLQRLERYQGLAVLATNLAKNIDPAFLRRLHIVIEFPMPGAAERRRIWSRCLPPGAPIGADLDLDALADQFEVSGGTIRNAMLGAAFLAADDGSAITMAHAVTSLRQELQKIGRLVSAQDFDRFAERPRVP